MITWAHEKSGRCHKLLNRRIKILVPHSPINSCDCQIAKISSPISWCIVLSKIFLPQDFTSPIPLIAHVKMNDNTTVTESFFLCKLWAKKTSEILGVLVSSAILDYSINDIKLHVFHDRLLLPMLNEQIRFRYNDGLYKNCVVLDLLHWGNKPLI